MMVGLWCYEWLESIYGGLIVVLLVYGLTYEGQKGGILNSTNYSHSKRVERVMWWELQEILTTGQLVIGAKETNLVSSRVITPLFINM